MDPSASARTLRLIARTAGSTAGNRALPDTLDIRTFAGDMRAAIDAGADVVIARDAATLAYAEARSDYAVVPLPWSRTWLLATQAAATTALDTAAITADFPRGLIGLPTRASVPPYWWRECVEPDSDAAASRDERVFYPRDDMTARVIAERIAALARGRTPAWLRERLGMNVRPTAVGVSQAELAMALRRRTALAVVYSVPRVSYGGCMNGTTDDEDLLVRGWHVAPLIETRHALVHRAAIGRVVVDADGTIRFRAPAPRGAR